MHEGQTMIKLRPAGGCGEWFFLTRWGRSKSKSEAAVFQTEAAARRKIAAVGQPGVEYRVVNLMGRSIETEGVS